MRKNSYYQRFRCPVSLAPIVSRLAKTESNQVTIFSNDEASWPKSRNITVIDELPLLKSRHRVRGLVYGAIRFVMTPDQKLFRSSISDEEKSKIPPILLTILGFIRGFFNFRNFSKPNRVLSFVMPLSPIARLNEFDLIVACSLNSASFLLASTAVPKCIVVELDHSAKLPNGFMHSCNRLE